MGWSSGSSLAEDVWSAITPILNGASHQTVDDVARKLVAAFEDRDCDTLEEVEGPIGDMSNRMNWECEGAPKNPKTGDIFTEPGPGESVRFDGKRWEWFE